jgi:hypothetical protein
MPNVSFANFSTKSAHAVIKYSQMIDSAPSAREVAHLTIPPGATKDLVLDTLEGDADLRNSFAISSDSSPGDLSVKLVAKSDSSLPEVELEAKDELDPNNGGSHPWSLENGTESTLLLFNHSAEAQEFSVAIAAGNMVWKKTYSPASMQTVAIHIASLVENGVKDNSGKALPKGVLSGQLLWFSPGPGLGKGRLLQSNRNLAMARNFSCGAEVVLCGAAINPTSATISIGGQVDFSTLLNFCSQARGQACSGSQVDSDPTGITYSWTSSNTSILSIPGSTDSPDATADGTGAGSADVTVDIEQPACNCSASLQASVNVAPTISMGSTIISGGPTQSAVVGQQISLTGNPAPPSGSTPWTVAGTTVGGFNTALTNGGPAPTNFTMAANTFYWVASGNALNVTYTINGQTASATFDVAGPTNPVVLTPLGAVQISPDGQFLEFGDSGSGATPGITFQGSLTPPLGFPGSFFWVQLINKSNYTFTPAGGSCSDVLGLDNTVPFDTRSTTSDSPEVAVFSDDIDIKWDFAAQMFLLWRPGIAKDIPVPLGSVNWQFFGHAVQNTSTKTWSIQTDSTKSAGSFTKSTSYPTWTTTFLNKVPPPCAK